MQLLIFQILINQRLAIEQKLCLDIFFSDERSLPKIEEQLVSIHHALRLEDIDKNEFDQMENVWKNSHQNPHQQHQQPPPLLNHHWNEEYQSFRPPHLQLLPSQLNEFERIYQQSQRPEQKWIEEYHSSKTDELEKQARSNIEDLEEVYQNSIKKVETGEDWANEYSNSSKNLNSRLEEESWFTQFLPAENKTKPQTPKSNSLQTFQRHHQYQPPHSAAAWTQEFLQRESNSNQQPQQSSDWSNEFERQKMKDELQNLTSKFSEIDDPKFRNSNFMKFIEKINNGKVSFENKTIVEEVED